MKSGMLIINESRIMRRLLSSYILAELPGFEVHITSTAEEGLKAAGEKSYDLIISANEMEKMDGIEVYRRLGLSPLNRDAPFILMTSNREEAFRQKLREEGINHCLYSPFTAIDLAHLIENALNPRAKRKYDRFGIPGVKAVIQFQTGRLESRALNVSLKGVLTEVEYQPGVTEPWEPEKIDILFPENYQNAQARDILAVACRKQVSKWGPDHRPSCCKWPGCFWKSPRKRKRSSK